MVTMGRPDACADRLPPKGILPERDFIARLAHKRITRVDACFGLFAIILVAFFDDNLGAACRS